MTSLLPRLRGTGQHRADTIRSLREDITKLLTWQAAADDYFAILVADRNELYAAYQEMAGRAAEAEIVAACTQSENERLQAELTAVKAQLANATAVSQPAGQRDIDPGDQPTVPVPLWQAPIAGPVIPTPANPAA